MAPIGWAMSANPLRYRTTSRRPRIAPSTFGDAGGLVRPGPLVATVMMTTNAAPARTTYSPSMTPIGLLVVIENAR